MGKYTKKITAHVDLLTKPQTLLFFFFFSSDDDFLCGESFPTFY